MPCQALINNDNTYKSGGDANDTDWSLSRLRDIKEIVEESLVLVVSKEVKLFEEKQDGLAVLATTPEGLQQELQRLGKRPLKMKQTLTLMFNLKMFNLKMRQRSRIPALGHTSH